jgi:hypothetical protein
MEEERCTGSGLKFWKSKFAEMTVPAFWNTNFIGWLLKIQDSQDLANIFHFTVFLKNLTNLTTIQLGSKIIQVTIVQRMSVRQRPSHI